MNALTIDLEYWWCNEFLTKYLPEKRIAHVIESVSPLLDLLHKYETHATFFVLGDLAKQYPELVETIYNDGHEIACHSYSHKALHELGEEGFQEEIKKSLDIIGKYHPIGFRAPSFSINNSTRWAFTILNKFGFKYDSSVFPARTMLYGVPGAPLDVYRPSLLDVAQNDPKGKIIEVPLTVLKFGTNIPFSGGFYFRLIPFWLFRIGLNEIVKKRPAVIYIHPWELYPVSYDLKAPFLSYFESNYGKKFALKKMEKLLKHFKFLPIKELIYAV
ncbi:MAG: polysaccharide deacetylase family protein [Candidatus Methanomethylicaceae archaeon]|jgi:polysaccharide deacetylase family protein (PEP-CTERM system associated)